MPDPAPDFSKDNIGTLPVKIEGDKILLIDQRHLPHQVEYFEATDLSTMCFAIKDMVVRGAPSIGVAAAFGLAKEAQHLALAKTATHQFLKDLDKQRGAGWGKKEVQ